MQIVFLGTGNAFAPQRDWSCMLVNGTILLDAGPTLLANLKRLPADPAAIRHIFISHFHGDHCFGLPFLLLDYHFLSRTDAPLAIIGPPGIEAWTREAMALAFPDVAGKGWPRPITFVEARAGETQSALGLRFMPLHMAHADGFLEAFGYRLLLSDGILAYSGDTRMTEALYTLIDGAHAVIIEATEYDESPYHLGHAEVKALLAALPPDCTVFLTHLDSPGPGPWDDLPVIIPDDLQMFTLGAAPSRPPRGAP
ncbi:MAG TPA: MBL fold metallo-hydrolase [Armatimonadota bacterium]|nr:MBL fold metallo-hydrolase [Armatimonadota bacterium]